MPGRLMDFLTRTQNDDYHPARLRGLRMTDTFTRLTIASDGALYFGGQIAIDGYAVNGSDLDPAGRFMKGCTGNVAHIAKWTGSAWRGLEAEPNTVSPSVTPTRIEWRCDYCGRPNGRHAETCKSCGGVRSFLYD